MSKAFLAVLAAGCSVIFAPAAFPQTANATLSGVIRDPQGAVVPHASITATQVDTGLMRQTASGDSGDYTIRDLPAGSYKVEASAPGFKTALLQSVSLQVNQTAQLDITLQIGRGF